MKEQLDKISNEDEEVINQLIEEEKGFTKVIQFLKEAGKPIIGHNMFFDILFTYEKFIDQLPPTYKDFAKAWKKHFPTVYDTKCLAKHTQETDKK